MAININNTWKTIIKAIVAAAVAVAGALGITSCMAG